MRQNLYIVAYLSAFEGGLKQEPVSAHTALEASVCYLKKHFEGTPEDLEEYSTFLATLTSMAELIDHVNNTDADINVMEIAR